MAFRRAGFGVILDQFQIFETAMLAEQKGSHFRCLEFVVLAI
jgi:hypothetical protein